jgi:Ulp1 family protease
LQFNRRKSSVFFANSPKPKHLLDALSNSESLDSLNTSLGFLNNAKTKAQKCLNKKYHNLYKINQEKLQISTSQSHLDKQSKLQAFLDKHNAQEVTENMILEELQMLTFEGKSCNDNHKSLQDTDVYSQIGDFSLTYKDIKKLYPKKWVNDQIINSYLKLLQPEPHAFILDTYFYQTLQTMAEQGWDIPKLTRIIARYGIYNFSEVPLIVFPVNIKQAHWVTVSINNNDQVIEYYDSFRSQNFENVCILIENFLENIGMGKYDWHEMETPIQEYAYDSGVFVMKTIQAVALNKDFFFCSEDMEFYRKVIMLELKHGKVFVDS